MSELTLMLLAALGVAIVATGVALGRRQYAHAAVGTAAVVLLVWLLLLVAPWLTGTLLAALALVGFVRFTRTQATVSRWGARSRRKAGVASTVDIARVGSAAAMRRQATILRPSLGELSWHQRLRQPTTGVAVPLCRVGPQRVWSSIEDVVCVFGGPRTGKTGYLAGRVLDAPGAVLVTSTRTDLHELTAELRAERGSVFVFNTVGLGDLPSTITFDPLTGCQDPVTATERASDLIAAGTQHDTGGERAWWDAQARRVLAALLHAAALGGLSMREVLGWVADPDSAQREVQALMRRSRNPPTPKRPPSS